MLDGAEPLDGGVVFVGTLDKTVGGGGAAVKRSPEPDHPLGAAERRAAIDDCGALRPRNGDLAPERDTLVAGERPAEHRGSPMPGAPEGVGCGPGLGSEGAGDVE